MKLLLKKKSTLVLLCALIISIVIITILSYIAIRNISNNDSDQMLLLMCKSGEKGLDSYLESVELSVNLISAYVEQDLSGLTEDRLAEHLERSKTVFREMAEMTSGVLTYYYRIDPEFSATDKGFWYVNLDGNGFKEHEVTDITLYDTEDTSSLVWFTVPKYNGNSVWLQPYYTDNLDVLVISYNAPVYWDEKFLGVIGIEIDYKTIANLANSLSLYENGYAFITDSEGKVVYHPIIDVTDPETAELKPEGILSENTYLTYTYEGVKKRAAWLPLKNGMHLYVSAPTSEINASWTKWALATVAVSAFLLITIAFMFVYIFRMMQNQKDAEDKNAALQRELKSAAEITELMSSMTTLLTNMPAMSFSKDASNGVYLACNKAFAVYAGKSEPDDVIGLTDYDLFSAEEAKRFVENDMTTLAMDEAYVYFEDVWDAAIEAQRYLQTTKKKYKDASGKTFILGMCVDVTETTKVKAEEAAELARQQKEQEKQAMEERYIKHLEQLSYQALHDELTGVYNRAGYDLILSERDLSSAYVLMVDADNFKSINDSYGHEIGDKVIVKLANTLKCNLRADDCICRIGGDEFVVFMVNVRKESRHLIASKIEQINRDLANTEDGVPPISVSVGITHGSEADDPAVLMELADKAMYQAKGKGKHGFTFSMD